MEYIIAYLAIGTLWTAWRAHVNREAIKELTEEASFMHPYGGFLASLVPVLAVLIWPLGVIKRILGIKP